MAPVAPGLLTGEFLNAKKNLVKDSFCIQDAHQKAPAGRLVVKGFVEVAGKHLHYVRMGEGPAVVMLHGFGDTGDMWAPLANALAADHKIVVPDLRGNGPILSSRERL